MLPSAIFLDLDDTILRFDGVGEQAWSEACDRFAPQLNLDPADLLKTVQHCAQIHWSDPERHRAGRHDLIKARTIIIKNALNHLGLTSDTIPKEMAIAYHTRRNELVHPFPGAIDTLHTFRARNIPLVMITNGEAAGQQAKVDRFQLAPFFEHILIEGALGFGKPEPQVFELAMDHLAVEPSEVWMVGNDLYYDIAPATELGIPTTWIDVDKTGLPEDSPVQPTRIINTLSEVFDHLT